jgi:hypothetical protein
LGNKATAMVQHLPITKARINLGQLARRVRTNKEYFILEKDGIPVIGIMDPDELEDYLELRDPKVQTRIRKSTAEFKAGKHRDARELLAELETEGKSARKQRRSKKA